MGSARDGSLVDVNINNFFQLVHFVLLSFTGSENAGPRGVVSLPISACNFPATLGTPLVLSAQCLEAYLLTSCLYMGWAALTTRRIFFVVGF